MAIGVRIVWLNNGVLFARMLSCSGNQEDSAWIATSMLLTWHDWVECGKQHADDTHGHTV